jgi:hypothetical protein
MSDEWLVFPCQMGEHGAWILYNHGIRDQLAEIAPPNLLRVRVAFKRPRPDGMYREEEANSLDALEDELLNLVQHGESVFVGRYTVEGHRHFLIYTPHAELTWAHWIDELSRRTGYELALIWEPDPEQRGYWDELFPSADDWQVVKDLQLLKVLQREGDDGSTPRRVAHWAYFPTRIAAAQFTQWAQAQGYDVQPVQTTDDGRFCVPLAHVGPVELREINSHTIPLRRKASELNGSYDGWETPLSRAS